MARSALIVGGGPAGAAAAIALAGAGISAQLIERSSGAHDPVCGGFLGWDALASLSKLGLDVTVLGARPITSLRIVSNRNAFEARLPRPAAGLARRTLDQALLERAAALGVWVRRGCTARAGDVARLSVRLDDGGEVQAEALLLATGKYELRGMSRPLEARGGAAVGLRCALSAPPAAVEKLKGVIELHLFNGGYAGLLLQEDGRINLCMSVARERLKRAGTVPRLIQTLSDERPELGSILCQSANSEWSAISGVPYGWRARSTTPGLYRIGDQAAVISSIAGDGIAIALESGLRAARSIAAGTGACDYQEAFASSAAWPLHLADALRWAAEHEASRGALMQLLAWMPGTAQLAAKLTRIGG